ncbi:MAG: ribonuclease HII [Micrococcales bacterium]
MSSSSFPSLSFEKEFFESGFDYIVGVDEVGRGALAGPVSVGLAVVSAQQVEDTPQWPSALRDSKLISERNREKLYPLICKWVAGFGVGSACASEIDAQGIIHSLAVSAERASAQIIDASRFGRGVVLLDGSHNWLGHSFLGCPVVVRPKADRDCVSVAAASVIAKVTRDREMIALAAEVDKLSAYKWDSNKGYASEAHIEAIRAFGPTTIHRQSWLRKILGQDTLF